MSAGGQPQLFQNAYYIANIFVGILYGVELMLYFQTMQRLRNHRGSDIFLVFFSTMLLILITIFVVIECLLGEEMWVVHQDYPGGPFAYFRSEISQRYQIAGTTAYILLQGLSDMVLIHRCWTVWGGDRKVIIVPGLLWLTTLAAGIFDLSVVASPNSGNFIGRAVYTGLVYYSLSIGLNILTTCMICGRILYHGFNIRNKIGNEFASTYFTLASIIVESALPYTLSGIAALVAFGTGSGISILFLSFYAMFTCISPQMLLLRIAEGKAWKKDTANRVSAISFAREGLSLERSTTQGRATETCWRADDQRHSQSEESQSRVATAV